MKTSAKRATRGAKHYKPRVGTATHNGALPFVEIPFMSAGPDPLRAITPLYREFLIQGRKTLASLVKKPRFAANIRRSLVRVVKAIPDGAIKDAVRLLGEEFDKAIKVLG